MEIVEGQLVASRAGRDVAKLYVVVGWQKDRVLLANGEKYRLLAPKAKNPRHLSPTGTVLAGAKMQTDNQLKQALAAYTQNRGAQKQGG